MNLKKIIFFANTEVLAFFLIYIYIIESRYDNIYRKNKNIIIY